jgi:hypothetical protein
VLHNYGFYGLPCLKALRFDFVTTGTYVVIGTIIKFVQFYMWERLGLNRESVNFGRVNKHSPKLDETKILTLFVNENLQNKIQ